MRPQLVFASIIGAVVASVSDEQNDTPVLRPTVWYNVDQSDWEHLRPTNSNKLHFSEDGNADPNSHFTFAALHGQSELPVVVLDHSSHIQDVRCAPGGFTLQLGPDVRERVQRLWASEFVAVTSELDCDGDPKDPQNFFWLVTHASVNAATGEVTATASELSPHDVFHNVTVGWGRHSPQRKSSRAASDPPPGDRNGQLAPPPPGYDSGFGPPPNDDNGYPASCGAAPSRNINGWVTADCGPEFDDQLNAALGYYDFQDDAEFSDVMRDFAPGIKTTLATSFETDALRPENNTNDATIGGHRAALSHAAAAHARVRKRFSFNILALAQEAADFISDIAQSAAEVTAQAFSNAATAVEQAATSAVQTVSAKLDSWTNFPIDDNTVIDITPPANQLVDSPFGGRAFPIFQGEHLSAHVGVFCVDCGIKGNAHLAGAIQYSITSLSLTKASISLDGSLAAKLGLGLSAEAQYSKNTEATIAEVALIGFFIPKFVTVGGSLHLGASLDFNIKATGKLLFTADAAITNYRAALDLVNSTNSQAVFKPTFNTSITAEGQIGTSARLGLPLSIRLGISVPPIGFDKSIALTNEPFVEGSAAFATTDPSGKCSGGVAYSFGLGDEVSANFLGSKKTLFTASGLPSTSGCVRIGKRELGPRKPIEAPPIENLSNTAPAEWGFEYTRIRDITNKWYLARTPHGILQLHSIDDSTASALLFAADRGVVVTDSASEVFYYSPSTMSSWGVSRLGLGAKNAIPRGSNIIGLPSVNWDNKTATPDVLVPMDTRGKSFYTMVCNLDGLTNEIFLVQNLVSGAAQLQRPEMEHVLTGGVVTNCVAVALWMEAQTPGYTSTNAKALLVHPKASAVKPRFLCRYFQRFC